MRNIKLTIEYDGTDYNGWQIQHKDQKRKGGRVKTIQGVLEGALFDLLGERVRLISSSRTDSGVHAENHTANFRSSAKLTSARIKKALNSLTPPDIVIKEAEEVRGDFNSQYDALSKTYRYLICNSEHISPFLRKYAYHFKQPLNFSLMRKEAKALIGRHNFSSFKSAYKGSDGGQRKNSIRTVKRLEIRSKKGLIEIIIEADGFLYNMARNIAGTLIEAGRGRFPSGSARHILKKKDRRLAGPTAPAKGLCLLNVKYA
ncbi:MAG: tRNA pseudouridine(38-40) synthase TruA [Candidatus Omnitrophica bacterium]|nr:tRNA pseudouridine(38-40) synthase TruA [Candidatus Omnitrophota bacterium]MBU4488931.1 tRNA pseudouridine(38-40) synthase TruA [Candidatus Omnitrophota bacterium]MCG2705327.1 tRNA pseudouridine(38-40) synthase TruA [Candidatus Omnitrophota bacterium]